MTDKNIIIKQLLNIFDKNNIEYKFDDYLYVDNILSYGEFIGFEQSVKYTLFKEDFIDLDQFEFELSYIKRTSNSHHIFLFLPEIVTHHESSKINRLKECLKDISYLIIVYQQKL